VVQTFAGNEDFALRSSAHNHPRRFSATARGWATARPEARRRPIYFYPPQPTREPKWGVSRAAEGNGDGVV